MNDSYGSTAHLRPIVDSSLWLLRWRETQRPRLRLFCLPYAGGSATVFRTWAQALGSEIDVVGIQLPGRGSRRHEPSITNFDLLTALVTEVVESTAGTTRFAFFGHSMGALLSFEVARRMQGRGTRLPECLFVSGRAAPHLAPERPRRQLLDDADFVDELRRLEGTPPEILDDPELLSFLMPTIRSDFELLESWRFKHSLPLNTPLFALTGRNDSHVDVEAAADWDRWTCCSFELLIYPGGHFFLHKQEARLLRDISDRLSNVLCA
ncbi:MAG: alpha/beta fold hydrolase [Burkholderiaceae bacterium]|jgi:surfactin synthase thioesterase subunit|nr:alpha/beta fold hydrolase [Burkholderiaceae bacterium]